MRRGRGGAAWDRVYVFISSTFNDMHGERDYLVKSVFPQLADWCEARRLRMVDVDLRWGVTEQDATRNRNVVNVCLKRIDECRPFFVCLLGQRYGWVPSEEDVSASTFDIFPGLADAVGGERSVTELEILHAIVSPFSPKEDPPRSDHAFFYQRHPGSLRGVPRAPAQLWRILSDRGEADPVARKFLLDRRRQLRKRTIPATGRAIVIYRARWNPAVPTPELAIPLRSPAVLPENIDRWRRQWKDAGVEVDDLEVAAHDRDKANGFNDRLTSGRLHDFTADVESLASRMLRDLRGAIEARFPDRAPLALETVLAEEVEQQEQFLFSAAEGFVERAGDFSTLDEYVKGASDRPLVVSAPGGAGKSMLLARWIDRISGAHGTALPGRLVYRFIGASDRSTAVPALLETLAQEIAEDAVTAREMPRDSATLRQQWPELLREAGERGPLCIVLDGLDQLQSGLADLTWIPGRLPPGVTFIVSLREDAPRADWALNRFRQSGAVFSSVRPFANLDDRRRLVRSYLSQYLKELDEEHLESMIGIDGAANPLFLKVALAELRVFGSFAGLRARIESDFGATPSSAFDAVLRRLEADASHSSVPHATAVPLMFGLLSQARRGLSADELAALLSAATGGPAGDAIHREAVKGFVYLALRQVRPYMARRQGRFDFFYETFRTSSDARYASGPAGVSRAPEDWHRQLADYFSSLPLWEGKGADRSPSARKVSELPYHLSMAGDGKRLAKTLTDLEFIEAKCAAGLTFDLMDDYHRVPSALRTPQLEQFAEFVRANAHVLSRWPELTFQQAANTITRSVDGQSAPAKAAVYRQVMGIETRPWVRRLNPTPAARACVMTFVGHEGSVIDAIVTPDGTRAISAGADGTLRVWDLGTGGVAEIARDVVSGTAGLAAIPGTSLLLAPAGNQLRLWDFEQLQTVGEMEGPHHGIDCLAVDAEGRWVIAGTSTTSGGSSRDAPPSVVVYDVETRRALDGLRLTRAVSSAALAPGGVAILQDNQGVGGYDISTGRTVGTAKFETQQLTRISVSPDGALFAVGSWGGEVRIYESRSFALVRSLPGTQGISQDVAFSPDGTEIAVSGLDGTIKIWSVSTGESLTTLRGHTALITSVAWTPDGSRLVTASADGTVRTWDPQFDRDFFAAARKSFAPRFAHLFADLDPPRLAIILEMSLHKMHGVRKHMNSVTGVSGALDGRRAVTVGIDDAVRVWNLETGESDHAMEGHEHGIWTVTCSSSGRTVATSDRAANIKLWDVASGVELATHCIFAGASEAGRGDIASQLFHEMQRPRIWPMSFSGDDRILFSADSIDNDIKAWDGRSLAKLFQLTGHSARVRSMACTRDGSRLITSSENGEVIVWDIASGRAIVRGGSSGRGNIAGELGPMTMVSGDLIAVAWADGSVRFLDTTTLAETGSLAATEGRVVSLSSAGDTLAVARKTGLEASVEIWRTGAERPVFSARFDTQFVSAACHPKGRFALGGPQTVLTIHDGGSGRPLLRYPETVSHFEFVGDRIVAGNDIGDVFLLEPMA